MSLPVLDLHLAQQVSILFRCLFGKGLQICFHLLIDILPLLLHTGIRIRLPVRLVSRPVLMVVYVKFLFQLCQPLFVQFPIQQQLKNTFGMQCFPFLFQFPIGFPSKEASGISDRSVIISIDQMFRGNVAAQVPQPGDGSCLPALPFRDIRL